LSRRRQRQGEDNDTDEYMKEHGPAPSIEVGKIRPALVIDWDRTPNPGGASDDHQQKQATKQLKAG
jgi:hypothetical protein